MRFDNKRANEFIDRHADTVNKKFYPRINFAAPIGWINDPNGVSIHNGEYHLFYQYYPYEPIHGPMHWGHAKTKNLLNWEHLSVALSPDQPYDDGGVYSGSALSYKDEHILMYTGHLPKENPEDTRQVQNVARSSDGVNYTKIDQNPVISSDDIPEGTSKIDFRDPKLFRHDGIFYAIIGSKNQDNQGQVLLYKSDNLVDWEYVNDILTSCEYLGDMAECPDLLLFDDKAVLLVSAMNYQEDGITFSHKTLMITGRMNWEKYQFDPEEKCQMDFGFDYYAPQSALESNGSYMAIAWQENWNSEMIPAKLDHKWTGQMTIPQSISWNTKDKLKRSIHPIIFENLNHVERINSISDSKTFDISDRPFISLEFCKSEGSQLSLSFQNNEGESFDFEFDLQSQRVKFSREHMKYPIKDKEGNLMVEREFHLDFLEKNRMDIILDRSSLQVYLNEFHSISNTYYSENALNQLKVSPINCSVDLEFANKA